MAQKKRRSYHQPRFTLIRRYGNRGLTYKACRSIAVARHASKLICAPLSSADAEHDLSRQEAESAVVARARKDLSLTAAYACMSAYGSASSLSAQHWISTIHQSPIRIAEWHSSQLKLSRMHARPSIGRLPSLSADLSSRMSLNGSPPRLEPSCECKLKHD